MKSVPGYSGYVVNDQGEIFSIRKYRKNATGRLIKLKPVISNKGYKKCGMIGDNGIKKLLSLHRVILIAFVGECPEGMEACHNNGDAGDNRLENLRWDTRKNNKADTIRQGKAKIPSLKGENHPLSKLNSMQVRIIRSYYMIDSSWGSIKFLSECFGVCHQTISDVVHKKMWTSV